MNPLCPPADEELRLFREEGVWNYSTMLLREEQGVLLLGAREAIYALDLHNITSKMAAVRPLEPTLWYSVFKNGRLMLYEGIGIR